MQCDRRGVTTHNNHNIPAGALAHDVAVERVEDALVRQLQRVVEHLLVLGRLEPRRVARLGRLRHLLLGHLAQTLVRVPWGE